MAVYLRDFPLESWILFFAEQKHLLLRVVFKKMNSIKEVTLIIALLVSASAVGVLTGNLLICILAAVLIWVAIQAREYRKVLRWSLRPLSKPANASNSWFGLAYGPFRSLMRQRDRTRSVVSQLREILGLIEVIPDAVITVSANGEIETLNRSAQAC